ncbi:hypothetical protein QL285_010245 [Trifolium repens]|nr:hypothetical protein QL285_010245 [Trifolium repens]
MQLHVRCATAIIVLYQNGLKIVGGILSDNYRFVAYESNSLAEESVVSRRFSTRFIFQSILEYLDSTWYRCIFDVSCMLVFGKGTILERKI